MTIRYNEDVRCTVCLEKRGAFFPHLRTVTTREVGELNFYEASACWATLWPTDSYYRPMEDCDAGLRPPGSTVNYVAVH